MSSPRGWTLGVAAAMIVGALGLAPPVVRYWSARFGSDASERLRQTSARALQPLPRVDDEADAPGPTPPPLATASGEPSEGLRPPAERDHSPPVTVANEEAEPEEESEPGSEVAPRAEALRAGGASAAPHPTAPHHAHETDPPSAGEVEPEPGEEEPPAIEESPAPAPTRRVSITVLEARTQPGLCKGANEAVDFRAAVVARFHAVSWDAGSLIYLDPRLRPGESTNLIAVLEHAERELARVLLLTPPRPDVFAYFDTRLLLAGGCTNENVVAYYDGALHVVPSHDDVAQSILHEYTHHALTAAGLLGPAWAHEGIAMHMAGETWWRGGWMERVLERPFSLEVMESAVPYTLRSDQAGLFYAQSAAMVECATRDDPQGLRGLVESLAAGNDRDELSYQLPPAAAPLAWRSCFTDLTR